MWSEGKRSERKKESRRKRARVGVAIDWKKFERQSARGKLCLCMCMGGGGFKRISEESAWVV